MQGSHALVIKRHLPAHQDIKDHSKTPYIHLWPTYSFTFNISGAVKYRDPQKVDKCLIGLYRLDRPKSIILMLPVLEMRMFSIFRSGAKVRDKQT